MQTPSGHKRARQAGFTLIEILIAMIIMSVVGTMLVYTWLSLQRGAEYTQAANTAASTGRDSLDRISSELRAAQPCATCTATPFCVTLASPYVCDGYDCTFYTPYNNANADLHSGTTGELAAIPTSIYLDTSGTGSQKKLMMWRDLNLDGVNDTGDQTMQLANNVVNSTLSTPRPIFTYVLDTGANGTFTTTTSLTSSNAKAVVAVNVEVTIDANLKHTPTYIDFVSTVRPRNVTTN